MGEGGAVYTDNPLLNKIIRSLRDWGRDCVCASGQDNLCGHRFDGQYGELPRGYDHKYVYSHFGYNLKATDMQAAVGCAQLKKFPSFVQRRRENFKVLYEGLSDLEDYFYLPEAVDNAAGRFQDSAGTAVLDRRPRPEPRFLPLVLLPFPACSRGAFGAIPGRFRSGSGHLFINGRTLHCE